MPSAVLGLLHEYRQTDRQTDRRQESDGQFLVGSLPEIQQ